MAFLLPPSPETASYKFLWRTNRYAPFEIRKKTGKRWVKVKESVPPSSHASTAVLHDSDRSPLTSIPSPHWHKQPPALTSAGQLPGRLRPPLYSFPLSFIRTLLDQAARLYKLVCAACLLRFHLFSLSFIFFVPLVIFFVRFVPKRCHWDLLDPVTYTLALNQEKFRVSNQPKPVWCLVCGEETGVPAETFSQTDLHTMRKQY